MNPEKVFKRYDIRGRYPEEIDEEFAERLGKAMGKFVRNQGSSQVIITKDNKPSSEKLLEKMVQGLKNTGINVLNAGTGPTDYNSFCCQQKNAYGVQITSSHLPRKFNGFKFIYPEGNSFENPDLEKLRENFRENDFTQSEGDSEPLEMKQKYIEKIQDFVGDTPERKIVWDSMGGASSAFMKQIVEGLGFELVEIQRDGIVQEPDPKPGNLEELAAKVEEENAYLGFANDLDADRLTVYRNGEWVSGDCLIGVFNETINSEKTVVSIDTSETVLEKLVETDIFRTRVGDPFVLGKMVEEKASFSAEPNGHYCFPQFVNYNSGILAGLMAAKADNKFFEKFNDLNIGEFSFKTENKNEMMKSIKGRVKERYEVVSEVDGIKFKVDSCSVLIRPSGTSPKIRVKIDGGSAEKVEQKLRSMFDKA